MLRFKLSITVLFFSLFTQLVNAQRSFPYSFKNGENHTLSLSNEIPENIPTNNYVIGIFKFSIIENGAIGPFLLDFKYQRIMNQNKNVFESFFTFQPIDSRALDGMNSGGYKLLNISLGATGKSYFSATTKYKKKKLTFPSSESYKGYYRPVYYRVKAPILVQNRYGVRYGAMYNQNTVYVYPDPTLPDGSVFEPSGQRVICFNLGISKARFINFDYSFAGSRNQTCKVTGEIYLDVLVSPFIGMYGSYYNSPTSTYHDKYRLQGADKKSVHPSYVGIRFGGQLRTIYANSKRVGNFYSYELAYYPGMQQNNIVVSVGFGLTLWGNNKIQSID